MAGPEIIKPPPQEIASKSERLSDWVMGNLLSALGNHEAKAIILLAMQPDIIYPTKELHKVFMSKQGDVPGWKINPTGPYQYCENSLSSPLSLVTMEVLEEGGLRTYGYIKTDYGIRIGDPLAGLLLDFSRRYPAFSLQDYFGSTQSSSKSQKISEDSDGLEYKKRAPITRLKIFWELLTSNLPIREADLVKGLEEYQRLLADHLQTLGDKKVILYDAEKRGESFAFYALSKDAPDEKPHPYRRWPSLTNFVYQALKGHPDTEWTIDAMEKFYLRKQGLIDEDGKLLRPSKDLRSSLSGILSHLERKGYAKRRKFSSTKHSEIELTSEQRAMLLELVTILDRFQNQNPQTLALGRKYACEIISNPQEIAELMKKAREHSSRANQRPLSETIDTILYIISAYPNGNTNDIQQLLEREGRRVGKHNIRVMLSELIKDGKIIYIEERGVRRFKIPE